jgi:hypothetical protein
MKQLLQKLQQIERITSEEKGPYDLFALFQREGMRVWDIVVSSQWINKRKVVSVSYIAQLLQKTFESDDFRMISHIEIVDVNAPDLNYLYDFPVEHGSVELRDCELFGMEFKRVYLITSMKRQPA